MIFLFLRAVKMLRMTDRNTNKCMCADYPPSRKEQIEESFRTGYPLLDLPPEAWPGYMAPILRGSHEATSELEIAPALFGTLPQ